jgi:hypothetical protein
METRKPMRDSPGETLKIMAERNGSVNAQQIWIEDNSENEHRPKRLKTSLGFARFH